MKPKGHEWTEAEDDVLRKRYAKEGPVVVAKDLNLTKYQVSHRARKLGLRCILEWTDEWQQLLRDRYVIDGPNVLASRLGVPYWAVIAKARRLGIDATRKKPPKNFEWTDAMITALKERYVSEGGDLLAQEFGLCLGVVRRKAASLGLHTIAGHKRWGKKRAESNSTYDLRYFDAWTPNMAYVLGFLFADGCVNKRLTTISVNVAAKDEAVLTFIRQELKSEQKIYRRAGRLDARTGNRSQDQSTLMIGSTVLVARLMELGLKPRKTYNDDPFPCVPDDALPHFTRGYLDGDGCVHINKHGACALGFVGSPRFIVGLRDALIRVVGVRTNSVSKHGTTTVWSSVRWGSLEDLRLLHDFVYPDGFGFCLERKRRKLVDWLAVPRAPRGYFFGNRQTGSLRPGFEGRPGC